MRYAPPYWSKLASWLVIDRERKWAVWVGIGALIGGSVHPSPPLPRCSATLDFVIPTEAEGSAVCVGGETEPGGNSPTAHSLCPKVKLQIPPLRSG